MKKKLNFLISGGTGFLGQSVVSFLKKEAEVVDVLSRSGKNGNIKGDLSRWLGGIDIEKEKSKKYDVFIHLAGLYNLAAKTSDLYVHNVAGTNTALQIANALEIPIFVNASSIASASNQTSELVSAYDLDLSIPFPDAYSESKALAEQLVKNHLRSIKIKINLRLGILVGDSVSGNILRLDGPYAVMNKLSKTKKIVKHWPWALPVPGNPDVKLPLVTVDQAAKAIVKFCRWGHTTSEVGYKSFNMVPESGLSVAQLYQSMFKQMGLEKMKFRYIRHVPKEVITKIGSVALNLPEEQLRYALNLPLFESKSTRDILGQRWCSEFKDYEKTFWSGYEKFLSDR